jgi:hypothetical protein
MKIKNKILIICFLVLGIKNVKAQDAVTSAGADVSGSGGSASYSLGQVCYTSNSGKSGIIGQGVQQPYDVIITDINVHPNITLLVSVYPNPSIAFINLKIEKLDLQNLSFELFDVQGGLLLNKKITSSETSIRMDDFAAGNYFLKISDNQTELKIFKITKN